MSRNYLALGAISAGLGVVLGAFAAHALKTRIEPQALAIFEVAVRYQMYHALALVAIGMLSARHPDRRLDWSGALFVAGTVLFSGSLYLLTLAGTKGIGLVTPLGGVMLIAGWLVLAGAALKVGRTNA